MTPRRMSALGAALAALALVGSGWARAAAAETGFKPLFNGRDLTGWSGDSQNWSVKDGQIVGSTESKPLKNNTFLRTEKTYSDFVLRAKIKLRNGNSGIQFRSEAMENNVVAGYQADAADEFWGMLYEERKRGMMPYWQALSEDQKAAIRGLAKAGDWNEYEITCQGDEIKMVFNGKAVCDITDPEGAKSGVIALQLHVGPGMEVRFKDIEIKELK